MRKKHKNRWERGCLYPAYIILIFLISMIFWFSSQQGIKSQRMSMDVCEKIVTFIDRNGKLDLDEKQYKNFVRFLDIPIRKAAHMAEYALVGMVLSIIVSFYVHSAWKRVVVVICLLTLAGGVDEVHQLFITAREGKWQDVVVDVIGGSAGMLFALGFIQDKRDDGEML